MIKWIGQHIFDLIARFRGDVYMQGLEEIADPGHVVTIDTTTGKLSYLNTPTGGGTANETTDNEIQITNDDPAFNHMGESIDSGTTFTDVFELILNPYNRSTISLTRVSFLFADTEGSYGSTPSHQSSSYNVEVGQKFKAVSFKYSLNPSNGSQTTDSSVAIAVSDSASETLQTGYADTVSNTTLDINPTHEYQQLTSGIDLEDGNDFDFKVSVEDSGDGGNIAATTITSSPVSIKARPRVKILGSATDGGAANGNEAGDTIALTAVEAKALFDSATGANNAVNGSSGSSYLSLKTKGDIVCSAISTMDVGSNNYTWVIYPSAWGNISQIFQAQYEILDDFESPVTSTFANQYGQDVSYNLYRSSWQNAFGTGKTITVKF